MVKENEYTEYGTQSDEVTVEVPNMLYSNESASLEQAEANRSAKQTEFVTGITEYTGKVLNTRIRVYSADNNDNIFLPEYENILGGNKGISSWISTRTANVGIQTSLSGSVACNFYR